MPNHTTELTYILDDCVRSIREEGATLRECLDSYPEYRDELREMLLTSFIMRDMLHDTAPSDTFKRASPERLKARLTPRAPAIDFRAIVLQMTKTAAAIIVLALGGLIGILGAADGATPDDLLYTLDRNIEHTRLILTADPQQRLALEVRYASERIAEAETLLSEGKVAEARILLVEYENQAGFIAAALSNEQTAENLSGEINFQKETITMLLETSPVAAQADLERALEVAEFGQAR